MNRQEFLRNLTGVGVGAVFFPGFLMSCDPTYDFYDSIEVNFSGNVLIIGAGSAGLTAGHILNQNDIDFQILEASDRYGGRVKKAENFVDFPIDLGAEWIHTHPSILAKILNNPNESASVDILNYAPESMYLWKNGKLKKRNFLTNFYSEWKFKNSTWFDFFDEFVVPGVSNRINLSTPVTSIDYSGSRVQVETAGQTYEADKVIVTVPLKMLQNGSIDFIPSFPAEKSTALEKVDMPDGIKIFIEMEEDFYPDITVDGGLGDFINDETGEKIYYDAAFRKDSNTNLLGLFTVGPQASKFTELSSDQESANALMDELDQIFDEKASRHYVQHIVQNWSKEPFIGGSYSHYRDYGAMDVLKRPIDDKVFFAGEAYSDESQATVHGAAETAWSVVKRILENS